EMVRAAVEAAVPNRALSTQLELRNTAWVQPVVVDGTTQITVALAAGEDGAIDFEIRTGDTTVHCQGQAVFVPATTPATIDVAAIAQRMAKGRIEPSAVYATCASHGLLYGPSFQGLTGIDRGSDELLAHLQLPQIVEHGADAYVLHPSLLDSALQGAVLLGETETSRPRLPFALESLRVHAPCSREMLAWVRSNASRLDVDLCDPRGNVCVELRGLTLRSAGNEVRPAAECVLAAPAWGEERGPLHAVENVEHHVILCDVRAELHGFDHVLSLASEPETSIAQRYTAHALAVFEQIQSILKSGSKALLQIVIADREEGVLLAGLSALLKTATAENPSLLGQIVFVHPEISAETLGRFLRAEKTQHPDPLVRYEADGTRHVARWQEVPQVAEPAPIAFRNDGVYLITGGRGGLGALFAKEIAERAPHARVILASRSERMDVRDAEQVRELIASIRSEHGRLDGVIHGAGLLADGFLLDKTSAQFAAVLAPKVDGAHHLDEAIGDAPLDFFVLLSSVVGALGNAGQADYAAANGFLDQFAAHRNRQVAAGKKHGRTRSINWPLWAEGGMQLSAAFRAQLEKTIGMQPLPTALGMQAFHRSLALPHDQLVVIAGDAARIRRTLFAEPVLETVVEEPVTLDDSALAEKTERYLRKQLAGVLQLPSHKIDVQVALSEYGIDSILAMQSINKLEQTFGTLPKTLFFEHQTVRGIAGYFVAHHPQKLAALFAAPAAEKVSPAIAKAPVAKRRFAPAQEPAQARAAQREPIAIVGLSGRYPEAVDVDAYWQNLRDGKDCIVPVPPERWDWQAHYDATRTEHGKHYSKWGGFIAGIDEFDPLFFNISPREAEYIDPQERLFLQHAWKAVEDAGYTRARLQEAASDRGLSGEVGVYVGVMWNEYQLFGVDVESPDRKVGFAGNVASIANRVSFILNLRGPSMTLDTLCSSSLSAIHYACQDLRLGRTSMAIAGGVNVTVHPNKYLILSVGQFISGDGHCQSFGVGGDGYIPAEGVGAVVLKRLSDAERDGDHIYGVIRGSALNHGGRTNGYTVPNPQAQAQAIGRALEDAQIDARQVSYIEAHGTGTKLGDPIEIAALTQAFAESTGEKAFCRIGSAKSNIGHCESAAGIAGLTKVLLQMQHRQIVPSLHSAELNPHIDFPATPFVVNQSLTAWEAPVIDGRVRPRIAGLSSFGAGGSNAHMIIEEYLAPTTQHATTGNAIIPLSARTPEQLDERVRDLRAFLVANGESDLRSVAWTLQAGREAMEERLCFAVTSIDQLLEKLDAHLAGEEDIEDAYRGAVKRNKETLSLFSADDLRQMVDRWIASGQFGKLAELWSRGIEPDWSRLYGGVQPRLVSLPTYPFARERYWIDVAANKPAASTAVLHPLLHANTSDLREQRYDSTFTGRESFLAGHQVLGRKVLPAAAYLEMVRAAVDHAAPREAATALELRDTVWVQPVVVDDATRISIALAEREDGIEFEVFSGEETIHCQGRAVFVPGAERARVDLAQLEAQMTEGRLDPDAVYDACARMGVAYGPAFRGITSVRRGKNQVLAQLRVPQGVEQPGAYGLHPNLLDSALQSCVALFADSSEPRLPFALKSLRILRPTVEEMVAWVRLAHLEVEIDLCDLNGNVCVEIRGLSLRAIGPIGTSTLLAVSAWQASEVTRGQRLELAAQHVLTLRLDPQQPIQRQYGEHALALFERVQSILRNLPDGNVLLQVVVTDELLAGLSGLLKSAALENPRFLGQLVIVPAEMATEDVNRLLEAEKHGELEALVRFDNGTRHVQRWQELAADDAKPAVAFKDNGVYLITGGRGALGQLFAQEILAQTTDARVILTGRSADAGELASPRVTYRQVDLGNPDDVTRLIAGIRADFGRLDGILHSAGMIADQFLVKKTAASLADVLEPKVSGTVHLDEATRDLPLDFFVLFSSFVGAMGNVGQADYAAANGFLDRFAAHRNRQVAAGLRHGRTLSINWPLWEAGGMGLDAASRDALRQVAGMQPLPTATGLRAFHRSLALGVDQILVAEGDRALLRRTLAAERPAVPERAPVAEVAPVAAAGLQEKTQQYFRRQFSELLKVPAHKIDPEAALEEYGIDSVLALQLINKLELTFGPLAKTLLFEYQTIRDLSRYFVLHHPARLHTLFTPAAVAPSVIQAPAAKPVARRRSGRQLTAARTATVETDAIAIVGLSGRYPEAIDVAAYWENLRDGKDCIVEVPKERWDWRQYFSDDRTQAGSHFSKWGGFIAGVDEFDALFFNVSPKEAMHIDPQERLFLQHAWMAIEDAGYSRSALETANGRVGVYAGVMWGEYQLFGAESTAQGKRLGVAGTNASVANRVSYALNLHGPSMTVDTMCSSSLTAIHLASQDLKQGRCSLAIAGGVNVSIHPNKYLALSAGQFLSSDGHCQSFGEGGDGYIPGEGVGVIVLKRLSDAQRDGDHIYGIVRASSVNHGGKTNGYTVPNPEAQASAIGDALAEAGVDARHVSYIEAHGTGTKLGDPIEIAALGKAFGRYTQDRGFCAIGSAKSNIGHCESAAGVAGLTKVLLQMQHKQIVPSLHSARLNPYIDFENSPFVVNQKLRTWESPVIDGRTLPRIAGLSSFGAGGSNAHLVIEEYVAPVRETVAGDVAIVLSARTATQLQQKIRDLAAFVREQQTIDLASLAYTLQVGREPMEERFGFVAGSVEQLLAGLDGDAAVDVYRGQAKANKDALSVFHADADLQQTVEKWIANRNLSRLLDLWAKGLEVDWASLHGDDKPQRIALPLYPFARDRHWIDLTPAKATAAAPAVLHPLLHANTSNLDAQSYRSIFTGAESFVALENGRKVLPAATCLEMARVAIEQATAERPENSVLTLSEIAWTQPVFVGEQQPVDIVLFVEDDGRIGYEISTNDELCCQGSATWTEAPAPAVVERKAITLAGSTVSAATATGSRSRITLSKPGAAPSVPPSDGIFTLDLGAPSSNAAALERMRNEPSLKVLVLKGSASERLPQLIDFPYPVIAALHGDAIGNGFLNAASCDFLVLNEDARYGSTAAEKALLEARFGTVRAERFLFGAAEWTGRQLRADGWTCPIVAASEVDAHAAKLASSLATMPREALRLLKAHLALPRVEATRIERPDAIAVVRANDDFPDASTHGAIVLLVEGDVSEALRRRIVDSDIPVIAALRGDARGHALLVAQLCDARVYDRNGLYSTANMDGTLLGAEILLTGADYSGAELHQRGAVAFAEESDDVLPAAMKLAAAWTRLPRTAIQLQTVNPETEATQLATPGPIALQSNVVTATVDADGIVVIHLEDRDAKNMFSEALLDGIREVFEHIDRTPSYKVVVLTGYETYFASGGTKESLVAIQEGKTRFTESGVFHVALACKLPVIAAMQGHGIGAGWSMGMFADLVFLGEESRYISPYMSYGFTPGAGATYSLPQKLGRDLAFESLFTAQQVTGRELKDRGLALPILPRAEVLDAALALAKQIAQSSRAQLIERKRLLTAHIPAALEETYRREVEMHEQTFVGQADTLAQIHRHFEHDVPAPAAPKAASAAKAAKSPKRTESVMDTLRRLLAAELMLQESDVQADAQFIDLGLDSITGVSWVRKINETYGTSIEATKIYSHSTLTQLSKHVAGEAGQIEAEPPAPVALPRIEEPVVTKPAVAPRRTRRAARIATSAPATQTTEPIAVIGIAGQFPQAKNLEQFWRNIAEGKNCITPVQRWDLDTFYRPGDPRPGKTNSQWMGALEDYAAFDPLFFNLSPTEAECMDPQQRLFLQACWHSIENAGYDPRSLSGSRCGVFVGCGSSDYQQLSREHSWSAQGFTGSAMSILAARISYFLNLRGASIAVDTACSSSLVALTNACDSLIAGGSDLAIAGGVYIMAGPEMHIRTAQAGMLSRDGKCYTFDDRADGFVPGEGVGVMLLKRLSDAERDGDNVQAIIRGWGVNQDGKTNGITAPNPESQTRLERDVYDKFGIDPAQIQLIEAHGTGTKLGDPIEVEGLKNAFRHYTQKSDYCAIGSVKTNIGHTLTAAGIAGALKLVLALQQRVLPPTINFERLNEHIDLRQTPFYVNTQSREWTVAGSEKRHAAISSFGFSGTNAHVVLAEYLAPAANAQPIAGKCLVPLSARTPQQLTQRVRDLLDHLRGAGRFLQLADIAYTLQVGRAAMEERLGIVAGSLAELQETLQAWLDGRNADNAYRGQGKRDLEAISVVSQDDEVRDAVVEKLIAGQNLSKLLKLWVKGLDLDWTRLYGERKPRRVSLPVYPFANDRYWIDAVVDAKTVASSVHPLLHRNDSSLHEQRYVATFTGDEAFLKDHRVRNGGPDPHKVLPAVAYLEMVRAAIQQTWPSALESAALELHDTIWLKPIVVDHAQDVAIALFPAEGDFVDYEVSTTHNGQPAIHCQGRASFQRSDAPARIDLAQIESRIGAHRLEAADVYSRFTAMGLHYGPAHQGITAIRLGDRELLADLELPPVVEASRQAYVLHPSLMDSALQASIGLVADANRIPDHPAVPFALASLRVLSPCTKEMVAWMRVSDGGSAGEIDVDIDLCDAQGNVCVQMRAFTLRRAAGEALAVPHSPKLSIKKSEPFDGDLYATLIDDVAAGRLTVDEAAELG
ncbi:MAG: SDR family NAD(P)-dependent oxidoreductase, partial [Acidobacteria bacterium]|nr:SDR family NAD(P)-dependent oxidoreductase [Acidobacteriota bacterium]